MKPQAVMDEFLDERIWAEKVTVESAVCVAVRADSVGAKGCSSLRSSPQETIRVVKQIMTGKK